MMNSIKSTFSRAADSWILTLITLLYSAEAVQSLDNYIIFVGLCALSTVVFYCQYGLELGIGVVSGVIKALEGDST